MGGIPAEPRERDKTGTRGEVERQHEGVQGEKGVGSRLEEPDAAVTSARQCVLTKAGKSTQRSDP